MASWRVIALALAASGLVVAGGRAAGASAAVLIVGDSLGVGTEPALRAALPGTAIDADVRNGRLSSEGVAVLGDRVGPQHDTVVFDLGTNDGPRGVDATARSLAAARELAAGRCLVVATLNHPPAGGASIAGQNEMIRTFAASTPNVALVDWARAAGSAGLLQADGVHATSAGYALRGALFAEAIRTCPSVGSRTGRATRGAGASTTKRPAARRGAPPAPSLERGIAEALGDWARDGAGGRFMASAGEVVADAGSSLVAVLTPRGPEPILGAGTSSDD